MPILIMFRSLTQAQRSARILEQAGITAAVAKAPQSTTEQGCTYCVRLPEKRMMSALQLLDNHNMHYGRILKADMNDIYREVGP